MATAYEKLEEESQRLAEEREAARRESKRRALTMQLRSKECDNCHRRVQYPKTLCAQCESEGV